MAAERPRLLVVDESQELRDTEPVKPGPSDTIVAVSAEAMMLALKALSQRAIAALAALFTLLTVGSVWWLWASIPDPSNTQIVSLGMYAAFIVAINIIVRKIK